jgi:hypothetical protein
MAGALLLGGEGSMWEWPCEPAQVRRALFERALFEKSCGKGPCEKGPVGIFFCCCCAVVEMHR